MKARNLCHRFSIQDEHLRLRLRHQQFEKIAVVFIHCVFPWDEERLAAKEFAVVEVFEFLFG